jgi:inosine/xanthosine triphosphate pyrophosphatase family protein
MNNGGKRLIIATNNAGKVREIKAILSGLFEDIVSLKDAGYEKLAIRGYLTVDGSEVTLTDGVLNMPKYSIVILK